MSDKDELARKKAERERQIQERKQAERKTVHDNAALADPKNQICP